MTHRLPLASVFNRTARFELLQANASGCNAPADIGRDYSYTSEPTKTQRVRVAQSWLSAGTSYKGRTRRPPPVSCVRTNSESSHRPRHGTETSKQEYLNCRAPSVVCGLQPKQERRDIALERNIKKIPGLCVCSKMNFVGSGGDEARSPNCEQSGQVKPQRMAIN